MRHGPRRRHRRLLQTILLLLTLSSHATAVSPAAQRVEAAFVVVPLPTQSPTPAPSPAIENPCADTIVHESVRTFRGLDPQNVSRILDGVRWRDLLINDMPCIRSNTRSTATRLFPTATSPPGTPTDLAEPFFLTGVDNSARRCGTFVQSLPNSYFFTDDLPRFRDRLVEAALIPDVMLPQLDSAVRGDIFMLSRPFAPDSGGAVSARTSCVYALSTPTPTPTPVPSPEPRDEDGGVCFPADGRVTLRDGRVLRMRQLRLGDWVRVDAGAYAPVLLFGHFGRRHRGGASARERFVEISAGNRSVRMTRGHFVSAEGGLVTAADVRVGGRVRVSLEGGVGWARVEGIRMVWGRGLFSPVTSTGDIVVDGVVASCYTDALRPVVAHAALAPVRAAFWAARAVRTVVGSGVWGRAPGRPQLRGSVRSGAGRMRVWGELVGVEVRKPYPECG